MSKSGTCHQDVSYGQAPAQPDISSDECNISAKSIYIDLKSLRPSNRELL